MPLPVCAVSRLATHARAHRLSIKFAPAKDVSSNLKFEVKEGGKGTVTLENAYSLKAQGIKATLDASQPTAGDGSLAFKLGADYSHDLVTVSAKHDQDKKQSEIAVTTGASSCNFWAGLKAVVKGGLKNDDSQLLVAYTGPIQVTATSSLDRSKMEVSVFSQVNDKFSAAASYSVAVVKDGDKKGSKANVAKVGFVNTLNSESSYRAIVSSEGSVALNYKQKLTAATTLCLGTKLSLASLSTPAAVTAGLSISL